MCFIRFWCILIEVLCLLFGLNLYCSVLICTDRRWSLLFVFDLYCLVLIGTVRCRYVLFRFDLYCSESMCSIQICSVPLDGDLFYSVLIFSFQCRFDVFYSALIYTDRRWSVPLGLNLYWSVLICSGRCRCVLPVFICTVSIWSVLFGADVFLQYLSALFGLVRTVRWPYVLLSFVLYYVTLIYSIRFWSVLCGLSLYCSMSTHFYLYCSVSMAFIRFLTVLFNIVLFYLVLICNVRFRCVLFGFILHCLTLFYFFGLDPVRFLYVLLGVDWFYLSWSVVFGFYL